MSLPSLPHTKTNPLTSLATPALTVGAARHTADSAFSKHTVLKCPHTLLFTQAHQDDIAPVVLTLMLPPDDREKLNSESYNGTDGKKKIALI